MSAPSIAHLLQASPAAALPGTWKLACGRAITLSPVNDGILRIAHGRVWATVDGPHGPAPGDSGDHVLEVGGSMWVRAGQSVVIETWGRVGSAYFSWDPMLSPVTVRQPVRQVCTAVVLQPLADLRQALGLAGGALGRLAAGVVRLGVDLVRVGSARAHPPRTRVGEAG